MSGVKPLPGTSRLVGYAFTLRYVPAREDLDFHVDYDNLRDPQRLAVEAIGDDEGSRHRCTRRTRGGVLRSHLDDAHPP